MKPKDLYKEGADWSFSELKEAFEVLKDLFGRAQSRTALQFRPGQRVRFGSKRGVDREGSVEKLNRTTVTVRVDRETDWGGDWQKLKVPRIWNVAPTLLQAVEDK